MAGMDLTAATAVMKTLYPNGQLPKDLVYANNAFLALVRKDTGFEGEDMKVPLQYGNPQGRGTSVAKAKQNKTPGKYKSFMLERRKDFGIASIQNEVIKASASNSGAFVRIAKREVDGALKNLVNTLAGDLFRSGTGSRGRIGVITSGVITLSDPNEVTQFEVDMTLQANATDGGTPRASLGYVVGVDRDASTVTVSATRNGGAGTPSGWLPNDYLLVEGDADGDGKISGLAAWIPQIAPVGADNFFGVNRTADVTRLAGIRYNGASLPIEEALTKAVARAAREGGMPRHCLTNFTSWAALEASLSSKVQYVDIEGKGEAAGIGFRAIRINGPAGPIDVIADRNCPGQKAYLLDMNTWCFHSLDKAPHIANDDGLTMLREGDDDACEIRVRYYGNLACDAPGYNAVVSLSA